MKMKSEYDRSRVVLQINSEMNTFEQTHNPNLLAGNFSLVLRVHMYHLLCFFDMRRCWIYCAKCQPWSNVLLQTVNRWQNEKQLTYLPNSKQIITLSGDIRETPSSRRSATRVVWYFRLWCDLTACRAIIWKTFMRLRTSGLKSWYPCCGSHSLVSTQTFITYAVCDIPIRHNVFKAKIHCINRFYMGLFFHLILTWVESGATSLTMNWYLSKLMN